MPKIFTSKTQKTGEVGENIAARFLMKQGFSILDRNFTKKYGEIDIVALKDLSAPDQPGGQAGKKIHFIEVKSVSRTSFDIDKIDDYRAEDNMHPWKLKRLSRVIQAYLLGNSKYEDMEWQVDLVVVFLDLQNKKAKIKVENDIIL